MTSFNHAKLGRIGGLVASGKFITANQKSGTAAPLIQAAPCVPVYRNTGGQGL